MLNRRAGLLVYIDSGASCGPIEAISERLKHLRGIDLGPDIAKCGYLLHLDGINGVSTHS